MIVCKDHHDVGPLGLSSGADGIREHAGQQE